MVTLNESRHGKSGHVKLKPVKVKEHQVLKIESEFLNGSDITESIRKGVVLDLRKKIPIKGISREYELIRAESKMRPSRQCVIYKLIIT